MVVPVPVGGSDEWKLAVFSSPQCICVRRRAIYQSLGTGAPSLLLIICQVIPVVAGQVQQECPATSLFITKKSQSCPKIV
jgi:hypothetical protein